MLLAHLLQSQPRPRRAATHWYACMHSVLKSIHVRSKIQTLQSKAFYLVYASKDIPVASPLGQQRSRKCKSLGEGGAFWALHAITCNFRRRWLVSTHKNVASQDAFFAFNGPILAVRHHLSCKMASASGHRT